MTTPCRKTETGDSDHAVEDVRSLKGQQEPAQQRDQQVTLAS